MTTTLLTRIAVLATVGILGGTGIAGLGPLDLKGHRSSLRAIATMTGGTVRSITLQGVGCNESMCSRVAIRTMNTDRTWFGGLTSIREISRDPSGPVTAVFGFRNGLERKESIGSGNRVLYVEGPFMTTEKSDLASIARLDFSESSK